MANGSLSARGLGDALDLRDEGHTQARAVAFVDRTQLERLDSQGVILLHSHPDAAAPGSAATGECNLNDTASVVWTAAAPVPEPDCRGSGCFRRPAEAGVGSEQEKPPMRHWWWSAVSLGLLGAMFASFGGTAAAGQDDGDDNELDRFMEQVLARRDENRIARRQYVFDELERFTVTGYDGEVYDAFAREYIWYRRDGVFVRSPVRIDGVTPSEADWRRYEAEWLEDEARRARDAAENPCAPGRATETPPAGGTEEDGEPSDPPDPADLAAAADLRPRFLSESYWLDFEFEPGNYYFAGREQLAGRAVLRIEYLPEQLFDERDADDPDCDRPAFVVPGAQDEFNKGALVTLWIDPAEQQIVRFTFDNIGFEFLPLRWLVRLDALTASMTMGRPLDGVWLPERIDASGVMTLASGSTEVAYNRTFSNYREARTGGRLRPLDTER